MTARLRLVAFVLVSLGLGACAPASVTRRAHGHTFEGRFVSPKAYEEGFLAGLAEAEGDLSRAELHLHRALRADPSSGDLWSRLALVTCRRGGSPEALFARAEREERDYVPTYERWGACAELRGDPSRAEALRRRARALEGAGAIGSGTRE